MKAADITESLIEQLKGLDKHPRAEVKTAAGIADVVTETAIYQVIAALTPDELTAAIRQAAAQREVLGTLRAIVVGQRSEEDITEACEEAKQQGVSIWFWGEHA